MRWNFRNQKRSEAKDEKLAYKNPLFQQRSWKSVVIENFSFFAWLLLLIFLVTVYLFFYSPIFEIHKVNIDGAKNSTSEYIKEKIVLWQLDQSKWIIFNQSNVFMFSKSWLKDNIAETYDLEQIIINKDFPNSIHISITEKKPVLLWQTKSNFYFLDANGIISSQVTNTDELPSMKIFADESGSDIKVGDMAISSEKVNFLLNLLNEIDGVPNIEIASYSTNHPLSTQINIQTTDDYDIIFDTQSDLSEQIIRLNRVLNESETAQTITEYIDLRFGERVIVK